MALLAPECKRAALKAANQSTDMYGVMAADRVMVKADGRDGACAAEIRAAVESVDMSRVETLAGK